MSAVGVSMTASPMDINGANASIAPGIYPGPGSATGLRYWNGAAWDPRPVARTWPRAGCNIIDNDIAGVVVFALLAFILIPFAFASLPDNDGLNSLAAWLPLLVVYIGYFTVSYRLWGRTPGMMLGRLYVIHIPSGQSKLGWGAAMGRATGLILGYACGIFTIIWLVTTASSRTKQGPHDSWARTGVLVEVGPPPGATHLVSGSAASIAATRGPSTAAPPSTPPPNPPASTPPPNRPASVAGVPQQAVQEGAEPAEKSGNETVSPEISLGDRARHSDDPDIASLAVSDDSQELAIEPQRHRTRLPLVLGVAAGFAGGLGSISQ